MYENTDNFFVPDFKDRRRLAEAEIISILQTKGAVYPVEYGEVILKFVTSEDEIISLGDAVQVSLAKKMSIQ